MIYKLKLYGLLVSRDSSFDVKKARPYLSAVASQAFFAQQYLKYKPKINIILALGILIGFLL